MNLVNKGHFETLARKFISYIKEFRDVRVLGLHVFVVVTLLVTWSGVVVIQDNYQLQKRITRLEKENEVQKLENETARLRNEYYSTEQYLELTARRQFGLAAPGETLVLVPEHVALANSVELPKPESKEEDRSKLDKPTYQKNFESWVRFLFRRELD